MNNVKRMKAIAWPIPYRSIKGQHVYDDVAISEACVSELKSFGFSEKRLDSVVCDLLSSLEEEKVNHEVDLFSFDINAIDPLNNVVDSIEVAWCRANKYGQVLLMTMAEVEPLTHFRFSELNTALN